MVTMPLNVDFEPPSRLSADCGAGYQPAAAFQGGSLTRRSSARRLENDRGRPLANRPQAASLPHMS